MIDPVWSLQVIEGRRKLFGDLCSRCGKTVVCVPRTLTESSGGRSFAEWIKQPSRANQLHLDGTPMCMGAAIFSLECRLAGLLPAACASSEEIRR